ncbi:uncharacterized protein LOC106167041 isoform X1 [Lingula anatina]|uniref:Uncharacterized protein LOC106167041 isoform X1 n=2 Tax=Lingula anatina TaxID=7574 RepID=A0A1S3ISI1_LINAN|nr:uncharacterized protein LOC106167041 isoform X1 [Lingula anatina]|eukprot:XP_013401165.1 uncharacterized protein LOC106167041 isoform X1 [Lingula anatina]
MSLDNGKPSYDADVLENVSDLKQIYIECIDDVDVMPLAKQLSLSQAVDFYDRRRTRHYGYPSNEHLAARKSLPLQRQIPVLDDNLKRLLHQASLANSSRPIQGTITATSGSLPPEVVRDYNKGATNPTVQVNLRKKPERPKVKKLAINRQVALNNWDPRREMRRVEQRVVFTEGISSVSRKPEPHLHVDRKYFLPANMPEDLKFVRENSKIAIDLSSSDDIPFCTVEVDKTKKAENQLSLPHISDNTESKNGRGKRRRSNGKPDIKNTTSAPSEGYFMQNIARLSPTSFVPLNSPSTTFYASREPSHLQPAHVVQINARTLDKSLNLNAVKPDKNNGFKKDKVFKSQLGASSDGVVGLRSIKIGESLSSAHLKQRQKELRALYPMYDWGIQQKSRNDIARKKDPSLSKNSFKEAKSNKQSRKNASLNIYQIDSDNLDAIGKNRAGRDSVKSMSDWSIDMDFPIWESSISHKNHKHKKNWSVWSFDENYDLDAYLDGTCYDSGAPFHGVQPDADNLLMPTTIPCKPKPKCVGGSVGVPNVHEENEIRKEKTKGERTETNTGGPPRQESHASLHPPPNTADDPTGNHTSTEMEHILPRIAESASSDKVNVQVSVKTLSLDPAQLEKHPEVHNGTPTICVTPPTTLQQSKMDAAPCPTDKSHSAGDSPVADKSANSNSYLQQNKGPKGQKLVKTGSKRDIVFISPAIQSPYEYQVY